MSRWGYGSLTFGSNDLCGYGDSNSRSTLCLFCLTVLTSFAVHLHRRTTSKKRHKILEAAASDRGRPSIKVRHLNLSFRNLYYETTIRVDLKMYTTLIPLRDLA